MATEAVGNGTKTSEDVEKRPIGQRGGEGGGGGEGFEVELRRPSEPSGLLDGGRDRWANGEPRRPRPIASRERKSLRRRVRRHVLFSLFFVYLKGSH